MCSSKTVIVLFGLFGDSLISRFVNLTLIFVKEGLTFGVN